LLCFVLSKAPLLACFNSGGGGAAADGLGCQLQGAASNSGLLYSLILSDPAVKQIHVVKAVSQPC
jgi:hypothetical protein